jgi:hypothetical protein
MDPKDAAYYGWVNPGVHPEPAQDTHPPAKTDKAERAEQGHFWNWLCLNNYVPGSVWHRTDKATGATPGTPDFIVPTWTGTIYIEFKMPGNWLSKAQEEFRAGLEAKGLELHICFSAGEAIALVKQKDRLW